MTDMSEHGDQSPKDPRSAEVVGDVEGVPEPIKPSVTGTVTGSEGEGEDEEQSDPGGDSDTT